MNAKRHLLIILAVLLLAPLGAAAQGKFLLTYSGFCVSNGPAGIFVVRKVNNNSFLRQFAAANGLASTRRLALVYHFNANELGDAIEIVNTANSNVLDTVFGLYFGEDSSFGRRALTNSFGTQARKIQYVYTKQNSHSMGTALIAQAFFPNPDAGVTNARAYGQIQYLVNPDSTQNAQICNGTFITGRRFQ